MSRSLHAMLFFRRRLRHPNIVMLFGHIITGNDILIVRSYISKVATWLLHLVWCNPKIEGTKYHCPQFVNSVQDVK